MLHEKVMIRPVTHYSQKKEVHELNSWYYKTNLDLCISKKKLHLFLRIGEWITIILQRFLKHFLYQWDALPCLISRIIIFFGRLIIEFHWNKFLFTGAEINIYKIGLSNLLSLKLCNFIPWHWVNVNNNRRYQFVRLMNWFIKNWFEIKYLLIKSIYILQTTCYYYFLRLQP